MITSALSRAFSGSRRLKSTKQIWFVCKKEYSNSAKPKYSTAGVIVIGDEILKGEVTDTNSRFLAQELHKLGVKLKKVCVIEDNLKNISEEVTNFSESFNYVITTGGIGPTHDDVTFEGVAIAFKESLYLNPELKNIVKNFYKTDDPLYVGMKLAYIPKSAKLFFKSVYGSDMIYPNVSVKNVYMFPGIPELLKKQFNACGPLLFKSDKRFYTKCIYCNLPEIDIVKELDQIVDEFPDVQFGCYPKVSSSLYKVKITIESSNQESTLQAFERLLALIPENSIVELDHLTKDL